MYMANGHISLEYIVDSGFTGYVLEDFIDITAGVLSVTASAINLLVDMTYAFLNPRLRHG